MLYFWRRSRDYVEDNLEGGRSRENPERGCKEMTADLSLLARGARREFRITAGLRAGYTADGVLFDVGQAVAIVERWVAERQRRALPTLSGMMTRGEIIYAKDGVAQREPVAIFSGEIPPLEPEPSDPEIEAALDELGARLAEGLLQEEISIAYRGEVWIMRRGEAVVS
jgi:hypothetical protein